MSTHEKQNSVHGGKEHRQRKEEYLDDEEEDENRSIIEGLAGAYKVKTLLGSGAGPLVASARTPLTPPEQGRRATPGWWRMSPATPQRNGQSSSSSCPCPLDSCRPSSGKHRMHACMHALAPCRSRDAPCRILQGDPAKGANTALAGDHFEPHVFSAFSPSSEIDPPST